MLTTVFTTATNCLPERSGSPQYCQAVMSAKTSLAITSTVRRYCQHRQLWQSPVLSGGTVSTYISGSPQYCLVSCHPRHLWSEWEVGEGNENLIYPSSWVFKRSLCAVKSYDMGPSALLPIRQKLCCRYLSPLKIHRFGRARTRNLWVQSQTY
jgi:hypothetical protein